MVKKIKSITQYRELSEKYFSECDSVNSACEPKMPLAKPYTLSGLLCALGLTREAFYSLEKSRDGRQFVEYVLMKIEAFIEENALSGRLSASAAQSSLKYSFGWNEKEKTTDESIKISLSDEAKKLGE